MRLTLQLCVFVFSLSCHSLQRITFGWKSAEHTLLRKHLLDFKRLSVGFWPYREWATFDSCFFFSNRADTSRLMSGGAIPARRYSSSSLVGFRKPVIALHAVLNPVCERDEISPRLVLHIQRRNNIKQALWF